MLISEGYDKASISQKYWNDLQTICAEYGMMAKLKGNSNIVYCEDVHYKKNPDDISWTLYIKMELLKPLNQVINHSVTYAQVIQLGMDISRALSACRKHRIIHRDIKPGNIMVAQDGSFKLGDFGVAKTLEGLSGGTKTGTYQYMAPEVFNCKPYDLSADIYSLGVVLYWLLNRRSGPFLPPPPVLPTAAETEIAMQRRFGGEPLPAPACGNAALQAVVMKACAYDPAQRYATPEELREALAAVQRELADKGELDAVLWKQDPQKGNIAGIDERTKGNSWDDETEKTKSEIVSTDVNDQEEAEKTAVKKQEIAKPPKTKRKALAVLLAVCPYTGIFGIHDLYLGKKSGIVKLCTINFLVFGWLYDVILIILGKYKTADGKYL